MSKGDPSSQSYDVVVVGSGIGGMTTAALLARSGIRVLVVERQDGPGGYAHSFRRAGYVIDPAVHSIFHQELYEALLGFLGVREHCTFLPISDFYTIVLPGLRIDAPFGIEAFTAAHTDRFPSQADAIRRFFDLCHQVHDEARQVPPRVGLKDLDRLAELRPAAFKYGKATVGEVLAEAIPDPQARMALGGISMILGSPPSRLSFVTFAQMLFGNLVNGAFYCQGGAQEIIDALAVALARCGGELVLNRGVRRIVVENGRAVGVELDDGLRVGASVVVSNADALQTFERLIGAQHLPESFMRRLQRLRPSISGFSLYAASRLDARRVNARQLMLCFKSWNEADWYPDGGTRGERGMFVLANPTLVDSTLAPTGEHLAILLVFAPYDIAVGWKSEKQRYEVGALEDVESVLPGFRESLTFSESATPLALEKFSLNTRGAIYGWENIPGQTGSRRLSQDTPVEGLFLVGHWTRPGSSFPRCTVSGIGLTGLVLDKLGRRDGAETFHFEGLPPA